jgi:hypothetical protein
VRRLSARLAALLAVLALAVSACGGDAPVDKTPNRLTPAERQAERESFAEQMQEDCPPYYYGGC